MGQTIENLNGEILAKYNQVLEEAKVSGKSERECREKARDEATKLPQFQAVKTWQDINAEIRLKKELEKMMKTLKTPALIIRSINMGDISVLRDLGLKIPTHGEIDLMMAYASEDSLTEVKISDTYPWQTEPGRLNKQAVNKAEKQLGEDVNIALGGTI